MYNLNKQMNKKQTKGRNRPTNTDNKLMSLRGRGWGLGKMDEEEWVVQAPNYGMNK